MKSKPNLLIAVLGMLSLAAVAAPPDVVLMPREFHRATIVRDGRTYELAGLTNQVTVVNRLADPVLAERYAAAWDIAYNTHVYGATNATMIANTYVFDRLFTTNISITTALGIQRDASRLATLEANLARYGGWMEWLAAVKTNIVLKTLYRKQ